MRSRAFLRQYAADLLPGKGGGCNNGGGIDMCSFHTVYMLKVLDVCQSKCLEFFKDGAQAISQKSLVNFFLIVADTGLENTDPVAARSFGVIKRNVGTAD